MRLWREHFSYLIYKNKDYYKFSDIAEDNYDYVNLECLKIKK